MDKCITINVHNAESIISDDSYAQNLCLTSESSQIENMCDDISEDNPIITNLECFIKGTVIIFTKNFFSLDDHILSKISSINIRIDVPIDVSIISIKTHYQGKYLKPRFNNNFAYMIDINYLPNFDICIEFEMSISRMVKRTSFFDIFKLFYISTLNDSINLTTNLKNISKEIMFDFDIRLFIANLNLVIDHAQNKRYIWAQVAIMDIITSLKRSKFYNRRFRDIHHIIKLLRILQDSILNADITKAIADKNKLFTILRYL